MVTSNRVSEKTVTMEPSSNQPMPTKTLLSEVNKHLTCILCRGYYIDATTIVECLHSFCRSCLIKHLKERNYCPDCGVMINMAKPNIKPDKALQDIVYKLVPGLFQKEMERRRAFYASRPGHAASATPEQRGEDTERIIFSPEDVISFSLEYMDLTDNESISSRSSSDSSNEPPSANPSLKRYIQCPAVVNIRQLKKFLCNKFDIDSTLYSIDILYKRLPLPDYYTLMDVAYIYTWKRNEPMRFFYQITDYTAVRSRLFDQKNSNFRERKPSPAPSGTSSPAPNLNDPSSDGSSGTSSPMPDDTSSSKLARETKTQNQNNRILSLKSASTDDSSNLSTESGEDVKQEPEDVEKSQFLNSFELTAKSSFGSNKSSPSKSPEIEKANGQDSKKEVKSPSSEAKIESVKRKLDEGSFSSDVKKTKHDTSPTKPKPNTSQSQHTSTASNTPGVTKNDKSLKPPISIPPSNLKNNQSTETMKPSAQILAKIQTYSRSAQEQQAIKRPSTTPVSSPAPRKKPDDSVSSVQQQLKVPPLRIPNPRLEEKKAEQHKVSTKKIPDLANAPILPNKPTIVKGIRTDLLANNSDPTTDRRKLLAQTNPSNPANQPQSNMSGQSLKSLFNSCKLNIPSSLSITLSEQKNEQQHIESVKPQDPKHTLSKNVLTNSSPMGLGKAPSPPVHNYIEILKLPDTDPKKPPPSANPKPPGVSKPEGSSAKGPVPSLKPISDTNIGKGQGFNKPTTFQQTFLQSLQQSEKQKLSKPKIPVPKLVPAIPKQIADGKTVPLTHPMTSSPILQKPKEGILDLTTNQTTPSQRTPQQNKALETMQSIADLAKKQNMPAKPQTNTTTDTSQTVAKTFPGIMNPLRTTMSTYQNKSKVVNTIAGSPNGAKPENLQVYPPAPRHSISSSPTGNFKSQTNPPQLLSTSQSSPRQTRSPSTSPKLVIAEDKQISPSTSENSQLSQTSSSNVSIMEQSSRLSPSIPKPVRIPKPPGAPKLSAVRLPVPKPGPSTMNPPNVNNASSTINPPSNINPLNADFLQQSQQLLARQAFMNPMEWMGQFDWANGAQMAQFLPPQWLKMNEALMKSIANQKQNEFKRDKK